MWGDPKVVLTADAGSRKPTSATSAATMRTYGLRSIGSKIKTFVGIVTKNNLTKRCVTIWTTRCV